MGYLGSTTLLKGIGLVPTLVIEEKGSTGTSDYLIYLGLLATAFTLIGSN